MHENAEQLNIRTKRIIVLVITVLIVAACVVLSLVVVPPLFSSLSDPEQFRTWIDSMGPASRLVMMGSIAIKVILPFLPGKPLEIGAGYAFGIVEGGLLCLIGATFGSLVVFLLVRTIGVKVLDLFYPREKLLEFGFLQNEKRLNVWVFFIMLIPGTPKDFFSYFVGLTKMKLSTWMIISPLARIPSILIAVVGGNALGTQDYVFAVGVFVVTALMSVIGLTTYTVISKRKKADKNG